MKNKNDISGTPSVEIEYSGPGASFGVNASDGNCSDQKFKDRQAGDARHQEVVYGPAESPENDISGAATPEVGNVT